MTSTIHLLFLCFLSHVYFVLAFPVDALASDPLVTLGDAAGELQCQNPVSSFDYSAKDRSTQDLPSCTANDEEDFGITSIFNLLMPTIEATDDYSCDESRPCSNGACCPKETGQCNYGPKACGLTGTSPNEVCWSNCDAKAECGRNADPPNKECPLNVCCSSFGFCGTTDEFCKVSDDEDDSCQSNCKQPKSTGSNGNVQKRIIGYYEAWNHNKTCMGMTMSDIPVNALTHAYFSFAYVTPGDFKIAPMDDLSTDLFSDFTAIKSGNPGLKTVVALGGWTFNDPGTATQPVFSNMVSTPENRKVFIGNLFGFMRKYGFDGVDIDWEYPGADDRGGHADDGKNFVTFLKELDDVNNEQPEKYTVSFTIPTSYWYLRHFDLKAVDHVDYINVMSYDLHGVWDASNPIGNKIYAHSNLTEIKEALNLLWRNDVPADKLSLGLGFYGRSFTLVDPLCSDPGCAFSAGGHPGPCSDSSGTLTYREIQHIIEDKQLTAHHDKEAAVKWISWDDNQWVSFDDKETFKQKIEFANEQGLSGLLIWAIDQDTQELDALQGVTAPKGIALFDRAAEDQAFWEKATVPDCYVSDCGGSCKPGWLSITKQPCGTAQPFSRHSDNYPSSLCCPLQGAPNKDDCEWRGTAPLCNGHCEDNEVTLQLNKWGDFGHYCEDGNKAYCCKAPVTEGHQCYWNGLNEECNGEDVEMTFSGTFLQLFDDLVHTFGGLTGKILVDTIKEAAEDAGIDMLKYYCCPKQDAAQFENCAGHGTPGTCFDDHCPIGSHSVQLTDSPYGLGEDCFPHVARTRVFCCDPTSGASPFLPVELENLFPNPPQGDNVETDHTLETDDDSDNPDDTAFSFVVMTSPEELQVSLDKRDGSHWELFGCEDTEDHEGEHKVRMVCTDTSEQSNCHKIGLGRGVPGTILQMPSGCGPGKYAVAKEMKIAHDQVLPRNHPVLERMTTQPISYDLTFNYEFERVPRDLGDTQLRIDYSNEPGYWDKVVAAAVDGSGKKKKRKVGQRSMADVGHSHKRWLEEEFREDAHYGALDSHEFHKRWFGETVLEWLGFMTSGEIERTFKHTLDDVVTAKLVEEEWSCAGRDGYLLAQAQTHVKVGTSFGFSLIASSLFPLDLSNSYLVFTNEGEITSTFTMEALMRFQYDSGEVNLGDPIPFPGAGIRIPGIATIGPQLALRGRLEAGVTLAASLEAQLDVVSWEYEYRLPETDGMDPATNSDKADYGDTGDKNGLLQPTFYAGVQAGGEAKAHIIASLEFGVNFDDKWDVKPLVAEVAADSWLRIDAAAGKSTVGDCPFTWGMKAGVDLFAQAQGFSWDTGRYSLPGSAQFTIYEGGTCPDLTEGSPTTTKKRDLVVEADHVSSYNDGQEQGLGDYAVHLNLSARGEGTADSSLPLQPLVKETEKRGLVIGPFLSVPVGSLICPNAASASGSKKSCEQISGWEPDELRGLSKRHSWKEDEILAEIVSAGNESTTLYTDEMMHHSSALGRRATKRSNPGCGKPMFAPSYEPSSTLFTVVPNALTYDYIDPTKCNDFKFGTRPPRPNIGEVYDTEHILELQLVPQFLDFMDEDPSEGGFGKIFPDYSPGSKTGDKPVQGLCPSITQLWNNVGGDNQFSMAPDPNKKDPLQLLMGVFPGNDRWADEFVLLERGVNAAKQGMWGTNAIRSEETMQSYQQADPHRAVRNLKDVMTALRYHQDSTIRSRLIKQKKRVTERIRELDEELMPKWQRVVLKGTNAGFKYRKWEAVGLADKWETFMKQKGEIAGKRAIDYLNDNIGKLKDAYISQLNQEQAEQGDPDLGVLIEKIKILDKQWSDYKDNAWTNPF